MSLTKPLTKALTRPLTSEATSAETFGERVSISGDSINNSAGSPLTLRGVNQGTWGENYSIDAPAIAGYGANHVRLLIRSNLGGPLTYEAGVDAYEDNGTNYFLSTHSAQFLQEIDWAIAEGMWVIVAYDSDQGQGVGRNDVPATGWDFFDGSGDAAIAREKFFKGWEWIAAQCKGRERILCYELLPEPLPYNSVAGDAVTLRAFYRELISRVRAVDSETPFLIGPRASYGPNNIDEALLTERTDCIYTIDALTNRVSSEGTIAALIEGFDDWCVTNNVPGLIQQLGRNTSEDIGDINADLVADTTENIGLTAMNGAMSVCNALGVHYTWWQYHQNTNNPGVYGLWYKTVYPGSGADNWTPKTNEINAFAYHMTQTHAAIIAALDAAATAVNGKLFRVKDDLSNVWQDTAGTVAVTAVNDPIGRIDAVVGTGSFTQATAGLRPLLALGPNGYTLDFSPAGAYLSYGSAYFASGEDMYVSISARIPTGNTVRTVFQCGTSATNPRYPMLSVAADDTISSSWRGDDTLLRAPVCVSVADDRAIVLSCTKQGANLKTHIQGVQEGSTVTDAVGSLASLTRTYWGAQTNAGNNPFGGTSASLLMAKTPPTDELRRDVDRAHAWMAGAPFRGAIPEPYSLFELADAGDGYNHPSLTYTRTGAFYLPQQDGSLALVAANTLGREWLPALSRYGYRVDPGWTQSLLWSTDLSNAAWTKAGTTTATETSPLGSHTVATLGVGGDVVQSVTKSAASQTWTGRFLVSGSDTALVLTVDDGTVTNRGRVVFNCAAGTITSTTNDGSFTGTTSSVIALSGSYSLVSITTTTNTTTAVRANAIRGNNSAKVAAVNLGQTTYPAPLVQSTTAAVTIGSPSWSGTLASLGLSLGSAYTFGIEYALAGLIDSSVAIALSNGTFNESLYINARASGAGGAATVSVVDGGAGQVSGLTGPVAAVGTLRKVATRIAANNFAVSFDGGAVLTDTSGSLPTIDRIILGASWTGSGNNLPGHILSAWVTTYGMTDAQLPAVTA